MSMIIAKSQRKANAKADNAGKSAPKAPRILEPVNNHIALAKQLGDCIVTENDGVTRARTTAMEVFTRLAHEAGKITRETLKSDYEPFVKDALARSGVSEKSIAPMASTYLSAFLAIANGCEVGTYTSISKFAMQVARPYLRNNNLAPKNGRTVGAASHNEPKGEKGEKSAKDKGETGEKSAKDKGDVDLMDESFRVVLAKFGGDKHACAWRVNALAAIIATKGAGKLFDAYLSGLLDRLEISLPGE